MTIRMSKHTTFGRVLRTGLSSLRDRATTRLAALRFNPSRRQRIAILGSFFFLVAVVAGAKGDVAFSLFYFVLTAWSLFELDRS
jgi:hypothetical protein